LRPAYEYCLDLLAARAYTARALRRKLAQREYPADEADSAIARLVENGLLDDKRYAAEFARQKLVHGGASSRRVEQQLAAKGIARDAIRAAIEDVSADETIDVGKTIEALVRKKLVSLAGLDREIKRRRVFAFLARRGFDIDDIKRAIELMIP
jgi:regulatory protein